MRISLARHTQCHAGAGLWCRAELCKCKAWSVERKSQHCRIKIRQCIAMEHVSACQFTDDPASTMRGLYTCSASTWHAENST